MRLTATVAETISITGKLTSPETATAVEGVMAFKCAAASSTDTVSATLRFPAAVASASYTPPGGAPSAAARALTAVEGSNGTQWVVPLVISTASGGTATGPVDAGSLAYRMAPGFNPPILKATATCKYSFQPLPPSSATPAAAAETADEDEKPKPPQPPLLQHRTTDVIVKAALHASLNGQPSKVQLVVQLPAPLAPGPVPAAPAVTLVPAPSSSPVESTIAAAAGPAYGDVTASKPPVRFDPQRAQLLWALLDGDAPLPAGATEEQVARAPAVLAPGKGAAEFKARVPVLRGACTPGVPTPAAGAPLAPPQPLAQQLLLPLQVRLVMTGFAACKPEILPGQPQAPIEAAPITYSSAVRAVYKA
jgi:hypothetical protein